MKKLPQSVRKAVPRVPAVIVGGLTASFASVLIFGKLSDEILEHQAMSLDTSVIHEAREMRSPALDRAMSIVTATGEPWALGVISTFIGAKWLRQNRKADVITLSLALLGGSLINQVLKTVFRRDRPALKLRRAHASGYSYPSGHAMLTLATYGTAAYLVGRHGSLTKHPVALLVWLPLLGLCGSVGFSRVYLEVHYPTDVIGGWAAGTIWLSTCGIARAFMEPEES